MKSPTKRILERALALGLLTKEQATRLARQHHAKKRPGVDGPRLEEVAVEMGLLTAEQAKRLREEEDKFETERTVAGYRLIEKIGSGSMGTVYKAIQLSLQRTVAIKILSPHLARNPSYVERFLREARAVARLSHPHVISGIDVGEAEGIRYFVMEYASGHTVQQLLDRGGPMDEARVLLIALQIAGALQHAHEAGLVHRDVKPDNILITGEGSAKLCDLGLAKDRPESGVSLGTPNYISPEQAQALDDVDIRSDLYSFGATLFHMLAGRPPFQGRAQVVMALHVKEEPPLLRTLESDISGTAEGIVARLLRKERRERFPSPKELVGALEQARDELRQTREGKVRTKVAAGAPALKRRRR